MSFPICEESLERLEGLDFFGWQFERWRYLSDVLRSPKWMITTKAALYSNVFEDCCIACVSYGELVRPIKGAVSGWLRRTTSRRYFSDRMCGYKSRNHTTELGSVFVEHNSYNHHVYGSTLVGLGFENHNRYISLRWVQACIDARTKARLLWNMIKLSSRLLIQSEREGSARLQVDHFKLSTQYSPIHLCLQLRICGADKEGTNYWRRR